MEGGCRMMDRGCGPMGGTCVEYWCHECQVLVE